MLLHRVFFASCSLCVGCKKAFGAISSRLKEMEKYTQSGVELIGALGNVSAFITPFVSMFIMLFGPAMVLSFGTLMVLVGYLGRLGLVCPC